MFHIRKKEYNKSDIGQSNMTKGIYEKYTLIEKRMGNHEWTMQRHWQHWVHKTQDTRHKTKWSIYLSWYDIPELVVPLRISLIEGYVEIITSKILRSPPWLCWPFWNICVSNDNGYVPLDVNTSRSFPHS
jgi:hypothetical protein